LSLPENIDKHRYNQTTIGVMIVCMNIALLVYFVVLRKNKDTNLIIARKKMVKSSFQIYINNYDDLEF